MFRSLKNESREIRFSFKKSKNFVQVGPSSEAMKVNAIVFGIFLIVLFVLLFFFLVYGLMMKNADLTSN